MKLTAVVHQAEEGGFWAEIPALPGCCAQGHTREELFANLQEAAEGCLACGLGDHQGAEPGLAAGSGAAVPGDQTVEITE